MDLETKRSNLRLAEVFDSWRVFPRVMMTAFFLGYCWLMAESWQWYKALPFETLEWTSLSALTAFPLALLTGLGAIFGSIYKNYQASGRDWSKPVLNGETEK